MTTDWLWVLGIGAYVLVGVAVAKWCRDEVRKTRKNEREYTEMLNGYADEHLTTPERFEWLIFGLGVVIWPLTVVMLVVFTVQDNRREGAE